MKLSTRARYGTRALLDLALHADSGPVRLKDIARRQDVSLQYLEHLVAPLIGAGLVSSIRGPRGGLVLGKRAGEIKMSQVVEVLEGSTAPVECVTNPDTCNRSATCAVRDLWVEIKDTVDGVMASLTLAEMVERQKKKEETKAEMYFI
ncbi:MAG: Rrf2 family transcriptional regulator [Dehalococcoidia bacterium]|jgi:Rrf2 family protein|nr:MAG: Rrf2 family transcriptional regulator [Dehalococcoidia bacterium]